MTLPLVTAVAPRWEAALAGVLAASGRVHLARRCADVAELLGVVGAGLGRVAVVSSDLRGLERSVLDTLREHDLLVLGVHPPSDEAAARTLRRWGLDVVVPADVEAVELELALGRLLDGTDAASRPPGEGPAGRPGHAEAGPRPPPSEGAVGAGSPTIPLTDAGDGSRPPRRDARPPLGGDGSPAGGGSGEDRPTAGAPGGDSAAPGGAPPPGGPSDDVVPRTEAPGPGEVVVVWGPTGSPGRTTVAVNLAAELADPLHPVVLVDADTYGASAAQVLAVLDEVPGVAAAARAADQGTLDRDTLARLAPEVCPGLRILTGLPRADRWPELRDVALADVLEQCRHLARYVVVDVAASLEQDEELSFDTLAPRRNGATLTALEVADRVVVVGTGDPVGLQRLVRGLDLLSACTHADRTVVVTRVRPGPVGPEPGRRIQEALDRFSSAGRVHLVPEDQEALDAALLQGRALREVRPRSAARAALAEVADVVAGRVPTSRRERARSGRRWGVTRRAAPA